MQATTQQYYVYSRDNQHLGPIAADLLARQVADGGLRDDVLVAPVGGASWAALATIPELAHAVRSASTPPPAIDAKPVEVEPKKTDEPNKDALDPRAKFLPLAIFGAFAFVGAIETVVALFILHR